MVKLSHSHRPQESRSNVNLISDLAAQLLGATSPSLIRQIVGDTIQALSGAKIVTVSRFDPILKSVGIGYITGFERIRKATEKHGWTKYTRNQVPISSMTDEEYADFTSGKLRFLKGGVHALSARSIPKIAATAIEKIFGIAAIYTMGFSWAGQLYGGVSLMMRHAGTPPNAEEIEAVVSLGAVALQRTIAEQERLDLEDRLVQAQKMEAVGRLAGGVAHDFNNLLTVITGYSDLALSNPADEEEVKNALEEISQAAEKASSLTQQLLAFSRKQVTRPEVLNLSKVAADLQSMLTRLVGEHIELNFPVESDGSCVRADRSQLEQVIINLIANARDAMPNGGAVHLSIETTNIEPDSELCASIPAGRYAALAVRDTGSGIEPEILEHIFEPFYTTKESGKGTGLGLATAYGIIRQAGGTIVPESVGGLGATMTVLLPAADCMEAEIKEEDGYTALTQGTETILLVEDESSVRQYLAALLEKQGYEVLAAPSPGPAIDLCSARRGDIDLLVTDLVMPEMNGRELSEEIGGRCGEIKTLFISGYTEDTVVQHGVHSGSLAFLQKPFDGLTFMSRIRSILDGDESNNGQNGS